MASITVRNLDDDLKRRLRIRAAQHGRPMEQEARDMARGILKEALDTERPVKEDLAGAIRARFAPLGGVDLELPPREPMPDPPQLD